MRLFTIDNENTITAFPAAKQIPEGQEHFASEKELAKLAANWPADRLVQTWNGFAGVAGFGGDLKPVKKFTDRKSAVARIWKAIQKLDAPDAPGCPLGRAGVAPKGKRSKTAATPKDAAPTAREGSKKAIVLELVGRKDGATLAEIAKATDWQNHSIRGFSSGLLRFRSHGFTRQSVTTCAKTPRVVNGTPSSSFRSRRRSFQQRPCSRVSTKL
jgi:hypothetical protein